MNEEMRPVSSVASNGVLVFSLILDRNLSADVVLD